MTTPNNPYGPPDNQGNQDGYNYDDQETTIINTGDGFGNTQGYGQYYDDPETTQFYPQQDGQVYDNFENSPHYDFSYDQMIDDFKRELDYINLPPSHKFNDEWVSKHYYDRAYEEGSKIGDMGWGIIHSFSRSYDNAVSKINEQSTTIEELEFKVQRATQSENGTRNHQIREEKRLEEERKELESEKTKHKTLLYSSIGVAVVCAIISVILLFMWTGAKNDTRSENQRGAAHQERITQLEDDLKDSQATLSSLDGQNKDLKSKNDALSKRARDAEKAADDSSKDLKSKDEEISKLKDDLEEATQEAPETVTHTAPPEVRENTITSTVTVPAPSDGEPSFDE